MVKRQSLYIDSLFLFFQRLSCLFKHFQRTPFLMTALPLIFLFSLNPAAFAGAGSGFMYSFEGKPAAQCIPPVDNSECPTLTEEVFPELEALYDSKADTAYMKAADLLEQCEFKAAIEQTAEAADIMKTYCKEAGSKFREQEKQVRCYASRHGEYNEQTGSYDLEAGTPEADHYQKIKKSLEDNAEIITVNLEMFSRIEEREKNIYRRFWEFKEIQDAYKKSLVEVEIAFEEKNLPGACAPVAALEKELNRLEGTCREVLLVEVDTRLKSPEDIIDDLDHMALSKSDMLLGRLDEADLAAAECAPDRVKDLIENVSIELDSIVSYKDGACSNSAPDSAGPRLIKLATWLTDVEKSRKEAEELLNRAGDQSRDICSYQNALSDQGGEDLIREKARSGCIADINERLDTITNTMIDQSAMASEQEDILSGTLLHISGIVDMEAVPPKCDVDRALKFIEDFESTSAVKCPVDSSAEPAEAEKQGGIVALQKKIRDKKEGLTLLSKTIEEDLKSLQEAVETIESEQDCTTAENLFKEQEIMVKYMSGCPQHASVIKEGLHAMKKRVDDLKGPGNTVCEKHPERVQLPENFFRMTWEEGREWLVSQGMKVALQEVADKTAEGGCISRESRGLIVRINADSWDPANKSLKAGDAVTLQFCSTSFERVRLPENFFKMTWKQGRDWLISQGMKVALQEVVDESAEGGCPDRDTMGLVGAISADSWKPGDRSLEKGDDVTLQFCGRVPERVFLTKALFTMTWQEGRDWLISKGLKVTVEEKEECIDHENRQGLVDEIKAESWNPRDGSIKVGDDIVLVYCRVLDEQGESDEFK